MREISRYPLCWPNNVARTAPHSRGTPQFKSPTLAGAVKLVLEEINRLNQRSWSYVDESVVISSNLRAKQNGLPDGTQSQPADVGIAVYFKLRFYQGNKWNERPIVMTCDKWNRVELNLRAIAMDIDAQRSRARWGCTDMRQAFQGYVAIPEKCGGKSWWDILGIPSNASLDQIKNGYQKRAKETHPDKPGGSHQAFSEVQQAYEQAMGSVK